MRRFRRLAFLGWPSVVIEDAEIHRSILGVLFLTGIILVALEELLAMGWDSRIAQLATGWYKM
jgi:hypothetical protein